MRSQQIIGLNILVVDDDLNLLRLYDRYLRCEGFAVTTAENAETAIDLLRRGRFQVLLADILLPGADGLELVRNARRENPCLICILMTASRSLHHAFEARGLGVEGYLLKPAGRADLLSAVRRAVENHGPDRSS